MTVVTALAALLSLTSVTFAVPTVDVIVPGGGNVSLNAGETYTGGTFLLSGSNRIVEGNGAILDLGGANIGMQSGAQMTLRNVTVRNGNGIFLTADCTIVLENVIFEACNYSALTTPGSTTIYRNCVFRNMSEAAISAQGGTVVAENCTIESGPGVLLANGVILNWQGGSVAAGPGPAFNLVDSGNRSRIILQNTTITGREAGLFATNFLEAEVTGCNFINCVRGVFFASAPSSVAVVSNSTFNSSGLTPSQAVRQEGINFQDVGTGIVDNCRVEQVRSGLVSLRTSTTVVRNSKFIRNLVNGVNMTQVGSGLIENSVFQGDVLRGEINVDDYDAVFLSQSTVTMKDTFIVDAADNGILCNQSNLFAENLWVGGSRTSNVSGRKIDAAPAGSPGSSIVIVNSTLMNARAQNLNVDETSTLTAVGVLSGFTDDRNSFPSLPTNPPGESWEGTGVQSLSKSFRVFNSLIYRPRSFGIQAANTGSSPISGSSEVRFCTIQGIPNLTPEAVLYTNAGSANALTDSHMFGISGSNRRTVLLATGSRVPEMNRNWIGNPGTQGLVALGSGLTNATDCYWGEANGPAIATAGTGGSASGTAGTFSVVPFLTEPPMASATGLMDVSSNGNGAFTIATGRVSANINIVGLQATRPDNNVTGSYSALIGLTDYRLNTPIGSAPPLQAGERRSQFALWLDRRLGFYIAGPNTRVTLSLSIDSVQSATGATLGWVRSDTSFTSVPASNVFVQDGRATAQFVFEDPTSLPSPSLVLTFSGVSDGPAPTPSPIPTTAPPTATPSPTVVGSTLYLAQFAGSSLNWTSAGFAPGFWDVPTSGPIGDAMRISASGSNNCAGEIASPAINVTGGDLLEVRFRIRSNVAPVNCPTLRLRIGEFPFFRDSALRVLESRVGGENGPGISPREYIMYYEVPPFVNQIKLFVDMLSFDPADDASAQVDLLRTEVRKVQF